MEQFSNYFLGQARSKKVFTRTSSQAEFRSMAQIMREVLLLKRKKLQGLPIKLYRENKAASSIIHNPVERAKHVKIDETLSRKSLNE